MLQLLSTAYVPPVLSVVSPADKRAEQYKILNEKELFLKRLENELGKGTTFDDGDEDDFE